MHRAREMLRLAVGGIGVFFLLSFFWKRVMAECSYCGNTKFGMVRYRRGFRVYCSRRCESLHTTSFWLKRVLRYLREMRRLRPST